MFPFNNEQLARRNPGLALYANYRQAEFPHGYLTFQDFIFRYLIKEGARLRLPVHIHSAVGISDYFNISQNNVMNLENILRDPRHSDATLVMIHGGDPLERQAIWRAAVKNDYMDSSLMEIDSHPSEVQEFPQTMAGNFSR